MPTHQPLPEQRLTGPVFIARPAPPKAVTADSSALDVMTDLKHTHAALIEPQTTMEAAHAYMVQRGVRLLMVITPERSLAGIITATDILGEKPLRISEERRIRHSEILVSDIMTPLDKLGALPIADVRHARVGQVVASLRESGRQHTLVMDSEPHGKLQICGIFSLTQIERQMGVTIQASGVAHSFADLEVALHAT